VGERKIHAGLPIPDDDATIAAALEDVSIPTLVLSLVHITGDPSWIRGDLKRQRLFLNEVQGSVSEEAKAQLRKRALDVIRTDREGGSQGPTPPIPALIRERMSWLVCSEVPDECVPMMLEEMELTGRDERAVDWSDVPAAACATRQPNLRHFSMR
jgi:4-hydroxyacetophenone monooxygenase